MFHFLFDSVVVLLYHLTHTILAVLIREVGNDWNRLVCLYLCCNLIIVRHNLGGIRLSICVLMDVDLFCRLMVIDCRFYTDIKRNKNNNRTYFLNEIQIKLNEKMQRDDELERMRR